MSSPTPRSGSATASTAKPRSGRCATRRGCSYFEEWDFPDSPFPKGPGYWALARHEDVFAASRNAQLFCSGQGSSIGDMPVELNEFFGSMINMDDPKHFRLRSLVAKGFTPKEVAKVEGYVTTKAAAVVDRMLEHNPGGECDFVEWIAAPLPLQIICEMMGIPESDTEQIFAWTNVILGAGDPEYGGSYEALMNAALGMFAYAQALGEDRRANPRDDITSVLMSAEVDGDRLTTPGVRVVLHPPRRGRQRDNAQRHQPRHEGAHRPPRPARALVRRLRGAHPHRRRGDRALGDAGHQLPPHGDRGHRAGRPADRRPATRSCCGTARRTATSGVFPDPVPLRRHAGRISRTQVGFGAGGPHFCLGANLARREIAVMFDELRRRLPDLRITGEPAFLESSFINGIKRLPCAWG